MFASFQQKAGLCDGEVQPIEAAPGPPERRAGPTGQHAAFSPGNYLQTGQAVCAASQRELPSRQELFPR